MAAAADYSRASQDGDPYYTVTAGGGGAATAETGAREEEEEEGGGADDLALPGWPAELVRTKRLEDGSLETYGDDVSDGVEARPVPWRNSLGDGALPPPVVYLQHCLAGDSEAVVAWVSKAAKPCRGDGLHSRAPQGATIRCSAWCPQPAPSLWLQQHEQIPRESERRLGHGLQWRLEVFRKSSEVGWALRTLEFIPKGALVMEYCGEHCSRATAERRVAAWRETDLSHGDWDPRRPTRRVRHRCPARSQRERLRQLQLLAKHAQVTAVWRALGPAPAARGLLRDAAHSRGRGADVPPRRSCRHLAKAPGRVGDTVPLRQQRLPQVGVSGAENRMPDHHGVRALV